MLDLYSPKTTQKTFEAFVPKLLPKSNRKPSSVNRQPDSGKPITRDPKSAKKSDKKTESVPEIVPERPVLFGFIYVSEALFNREVMNSYLTCHMFALDEVSSSKLVAFDSNPIYNFSQQIPLILEEDFLLKLRENFMVVEFFEKGQGKDFLIGLAKLPLHQFYLAYRNSVIVKYLSERKLPVIGADGWESVFSPSNGEVVGQAQILLALGTKEQIENLESERGFRKNTVKAKTPVRKKINVATQSEMEPQKDNEPVVPTQKTNPVVETSTNTEPEMEVRSTSDLLDTLQKALSIDNVREKNYFRAHIAINSALHLPSRRKCKSKKSKGRNGKHEDILPSTYVTFECFKGELKMTQIVPKNTSPKWDFSCDVSLPLEYLTDNQKFLVFKVWRKSTNTTMTPNMQVDHVIGFATVDLTVLAAGLPSVQGWFNINDLSKKCNGQINIHVTPLENVIKYRPQECCEGESSSPSQPPEAPFEPGELLGRALKRKFTELDEITQRLRLRLSKVTNDESDTSNDEIADEFERDINTLCVEDDFDMVDFEKEAQKFNLNHTKDSEVGLLQTDENLVENKQKIDHLLEKLSLISGEMSSRYVSGCSYDAEAILNELDSGSRPNLHSGVSFNREMSERFGGFDSERSGPEGEGQSNIVKSDQHLI
ncbi:C2 domain-containing protein 3 [Tribolium castaneum]|nr:PREDICTED: C2 domain-containing protein 3 [Tribolium castaneum]|eukprot:XP_008191715.1 PREDICTED: C2 domain-containing protein 3 [Tribolium castaneum]